MKSKLIYNESVITRLNQILMLMAFISIAAHYPEAQQIIKYINYISILLILFSLKFFINDDLRIIKKHFNQLFFINIVFIHRIAADLAGALRSLQNDVYYDLYASKVWLRYTNDYFFNTIVFTCLLSIILIFLVFSVGNIKKMKTLFIKYCCLVLFFYLTIYFQFKVQYFIVNVLK